MPTTRGVLDQHPKCFSENHLHGVLADTHRVPCCREERQMSSVQVTLIEEAITPTDKMESNASACWAWADIEDVLSDEWEIGGLAMTTDAIRALFTRE